MIWEELTDAGVLGLNRRNRELIQRFNPRARLPLADDKIRTKRLCTEEDVATPKLLGVIESHSQMSRIPDLVGEASGFALKPAHGAQGNGILIVTHRAGERFVSSRGRRLDLGDLRFRVSEILAGRFSLAGQEDEAFFEELLQVHPGLAEICSGGVPDVRIVVYRGHPVMGMLRLPTERSQGRANLHKGAVGAGLDLRTGELSTAVCEDRFVERHPDTGAPVVGVKVPDFESLLVQAVRAADGADLGYVGVDLVLDAERGPVVLELNARPGLSIQLANESGLRPRLRAVDEALGAMPDASAGDRIEFCRALDGEAWREGA
ncbi:MAG: alpha-L-glutamate ligase-like protein [Spirochaetaceae bacterium]|nr:alpha-L-glutamate ligase-like protein [Spirochaetaceae bacterium]HPG26934.1 alpha-L-glutamate ligase-like protein [Myxococcota bacterium]